MSDMIRDLVTSAVDTAHNSTNRLDYLKDAVKLRLGGRGQTISAEQFCELLTDTQDLIAQDIKVLGDAVKPQ